MKILVVFSLNIYIIYILTLYAFLEMSYINTERKDIHKI